MVKSIISMLVVAVGFAVGGGIAGTVGGLIGGSAAYAALLLVGEKIDGRRKTEGFWLRNRVAFLVFLSVVLGITVGQALVPGLVGFLLGGAGGYWAANRLAESWGWSGQAFQAKVQLGTQYVAILVSAASANGAVSAGEKREIARVSKQILECFGYGEDQDVEELVGLALSSPPTAQQSGEMIRQLPAELQEAIQFDLMRVLCAEGDLSDADRTWLTACICASGIGDWSIVGFYDRDIASSRGAHGGSRHVWLSELGLAEEASDAEIKAAYRQMALKYHPDRLPPHAPPQTRAMAEAKMVRVIEAYNNLTKGHDHGRACLYLKEPGRAASFSPNGSPSFACECWLCRQVNRVSVANRIESSRCAQCHALLALSFDPLRQA